MIIYFSDRFGNVLGTAASNLPDNIDLISESMTDDLGSGVKVFDCTVNATEQLKEIAVANNYVLAYGTLFQIMTASYRSLDKTITLYCEDAGLDFINKICGPVSSSSKTLKGWIENTLGTEEASGWKYVFNIPNTSKTLEYTSESTAKERLMDILANYDAEMYCSYEIKGLKWVERYINITQKRGTAENAKKLYLNKEVLSINQTESVMDLANVWIMYGNNSTQLSKLKGYSSVAKHYERDGHEYEVAGNEVRCLDSIQNNKTKINQSGRITQVKTTDYKKASECIDYAIREMTKIVEPVFSYEIEFVVIPDDLECGDYVYVIDEADQILLYARVQSIVRSEFGQEQAILGEYSILRSSIKEIDFSELNLTIKSITITSSNGVTAANKLTTRLTATVYENGNIINSQEDLEPGESLQWYKNGQIISGATDFELNVEITSSTKYTCRLIGGE